MKEVNGAEDMKRVVTDEEAKAWVEWFDEWCKQVEETDRLEPLDEDFEDFQRRYKCLPV
jgi:hypothetical protein